MNPTFSELPQPVGGGLSISAWQPPWKGREGSPTHQLETSVANLGTPVAPPFPSSLSSSFSSSS